MRLLHTKTLKLEYFAEEVPYYAMVSHTWGTDEFLFEDLQGDFQAQLERPKRGLRKVLEACRRAVKDGLDYVWVDTCCIDKSSSAELSEAINSMFQWYQYADICYIHLEDVRLEDDGTFTNFEGSRWFKRGWTLQELLAPRRAEFFDMGWNYMAERRELAARVSAITTIDEALLKGTVFSAVHETSVATIMGWAARRETTREEDGAYCLMGLFKINMPLLYGEGVEAFQRLQEHVLAKYPMDQSILAWAPSWLSGPLAADISEFNFGEDVRLRVRPIPSRMFQNGGMKQTPRGVKVDVLLVPFRSEEERSDLKAMVAVLTCFFDDQPLHRVGILVQKPSGTSSRDNIFMRSDKNVLVMVSPPGEVRLLRPKETPDQMISRQRREDLEQEARPKALDMDNKRTARILLLNSPAIRLMETVGSGASANDYYMHETRPLSLNIEYHISIELKSSYPEPRHHPVGSVVHYMLPRAPLTEHARHKYRLGSPYEPGQFEARELRLHGIAHFGRIDLPDFFIIWGTRRVTSSEPSRAPTPSHWSCAILDYWQLTGTQKPVETSLHRESLAQNSRSLEDALGQYVNRQLATGGRSDMDFSSSTSRNDRLAVWAEFRETEFLGMKDIRLHVGELGTDGDGEPFTSRKTSAS